MQNGSTLTGITGRKNIAAAMTINTEPVSIFFVRPLKANDRVFVSTS
jgi:hypothetical protein